MVILNEVKDLVVPAFPPLSSSPSSPSVILDISNRGSILLFPSLLSSPTHRGSRVVVGAASHAARPLCSPDSCGRACAPVPKPRKPLSPPVILDACPDILNRGSSQRRDPVPLQLVFAPAASHAAIFQEVVILNKVKVLLVPHSVIPAKAGSQRRSLSSLTLPFLRTAFDNDTYGILQ